MNLDSGTLSIFRLVNAADPGLMPVMSETIVLQSCYAERTVGFSRYYNAKQADMQIDMLVRIPRSYEIKTGDRVRLSPYSHPASDLPYLIIQIQQVDDEDTALPATDLTLRTMTESEGAQ